MERVNKQIKDSCRMAHCAFHINANLFHYMKTAVQSVSTVAQDSLSLSVQDLCYIIESGNIKIKRRTHRCRHFACQQRRGREQEKSNQPTYRTGMSAMAVTRPKPSIPTK